VLHDNLIDNILSLVVSQSRKVVSDLWSAVDSFRSYVGDVVTTRIVRFPRYTPVSAILYERRRRTAHRVMRASLGQYVPWTIKAGHTGNYTVSA
jgi:hypothetical protein